jgi:hypothetical protein
MVSFGSRRGAADNLSVYLMAGAFFAVAGLMYWLNIRAAPVEVEVVEGGPIMETNVPTVVASDVFGADPMAQEGTLIQLDGLPVTMVIGSETFFVDAPPAGSYLVKMSTELATSGVLVEQDATLSLVGAVHAMSDSAANAWVASGGLPEGQRALADFAMSFFEATGVTVTGQPEGN